MSNVICVEINKNVTIQYGYIIKDNGHTCDVLILDKNSFLSAMSQVNNYPKNLIFNFEQKEQLFFLIKSFFKFKKEEQLRNYNLNLTLKNKEKTDQKNELINEIKNLANLLATAKTDLEINSYTKDIIKKRKILLSLQSSLKETEKNHIKNIITSLTDRENDLIMSINDRIKRTKTENINYKTNYRYILEKFNLKVNEKFKLTDTKYNKFYIYSVDNSGLLVEHNNEIKNDFFFNQYYDLFVEILNGNYILEKIKEE